MLEARVIGSEKVARLADEPEEKRLTPP